ncbi:MAG TPA: ATP-binding cassette domain-containing protein, partial [Trueperaceae bacterium]|nr:ATP-binding cassette domain-containing protein [Trueperaceae bacterium]
LAKKRIDNLSEDARSDVRLHNTGFIFQNWSLLPTLNAIENVAFPMLLAGVGKDERIAKAAGLLDSFGLKHRAKHKASQLSGGEQQRIAIARALILEPQVLFADEPTGNLDSASGDIVLELLKQHTQGERRLVLVTHDAEVAKLSDRILYFRDGKFERIEELTR